VGGCGLVNLRVGPVADPFEHFDEPSVSMKGGEFFH
jgi:hypothetical protein